MSYDLALVPRWIQKSESKFRDNIASFLLGLCGLVLLAQVSIPLPWTPVPITGQTFGVYYLALVWGRKRALAVFLTYLILGGFGLPVFASGSSGLVFGPTLGYLAGMAAATFWLGSLADWGWTSTWFKTYLACFSSSLIIFAFGIFGLSFFIPAENLLTAGVLPFLPGDLLKTILATTLAMKTSNAFKN